MALFWSLDDLGLLGPLIQTHPASPKVAGGSMARGFRRPGQAELDSGGLNVNARLF